MDAQLASKIKEDLETGCWVWTAYKDRYGYGKINYGGRPPKGRVHFAHRLVYQLEKGPIPEGLVLDHLCRNPSCVNPRHLEAVTQFDNLIRGLLKTAQTHCKHGHLLEEDNIIFNKKYPRRRRCRTCHKISEARRRARMRGGE